jgi:hypothetical protein
VKWYGYLESDMDSDLVGENGMEVGEGEMEAANILYNHG